MPSLPEPNVNDSIKRLKAQIRKMSELTREAQVVDQVLLHSLQDLKSIALTIIDQFQKQKKIILQRFDQRIMPIAQDVLEGLLLDANRLKIQLEEKLENIIEITEEEWVEEATHWDQLYSKWNDKTNLTQRILEVVADQTARLINKDLQVIQDYQSQSLSYLPEDEFKDLECRLSQAIEEPLKQLKSLPAQAKEHTSIQQASEWIANLQEHRENYFDQLLMKIDHVMNDVVKNPPHFEEIEDLALWGEVEGEIIFMERELLSIHEELVEVYFLEKEEKQFLLSRLEGLLDHAEDIEKYAPPESLRERMNTIKSDIESTIHRLNER